MKETYTLPANWAPLLINGDFIEEHEAEAAYAFLSYRKLPNPVTCGDNYFSWNNDATSQGGDVCDYTFIL